MFKVGDLVMIKKNNDFSFGGGLLAIVLELPLGDSDLDLDDPNCLLFIPSLEEEIYFFKHELDLV